MKFHLFEGNETEALCGVSINKMHRHADADDLMCNECRNLCHDTIMAPNDESIRSWNMVRYMNSDKLSGPIV